MRSTTPFVTLVGFAMIVGGCARSDTTELAQARADAKAVREELDATRAELEATKAALAKAKAEARAKPPIQPVQRNDRAPEQRPIAKRPNEKPQFDEKNFERAITEFVGYQIDDYRKLPNCLTIFKECVAVPFGGKTEEQYKSALLSVAMKPCRVVLRVVEVPAEYDYAMFEMLTDDGKSAMDELVRGGDRGSYPKCLKMPFAINNVKAKGLDAKRRSIGDRVVLVGLGYVVAASPWGAANPTHGVPRGDSRHVTLRAFGKPNSYHPSDYEFAFMVRNWYVAEQ